jgi:competence protein ComEC
MAGTSDTAIASGHLAGGLSGKFAVKLAPLWGAFGRAFETEVALRRPFLWLPVAAGTGVVLYLYADREPSLWLIAPAAVSLGVLAYFARANRVAFFFLCGFCAVFAGELSAALRTARVAAPVIAKIRIVTLEGFIEEMDFRRNGARFLLRVHSAEGLAPEQPPFRVRLTMRRTPPFEAGTYVSLKARLLPPPARTFPAAMISRATPGSRGSARSAMCWGALRLRRLPNRPGSRPLS